MPQPVRQFEAVYPPGCSSFMGQSQVLSDPKNSGLSTQQWLLWLLGRSPLRSTLVHQAQISGSRAEPNGAAECSGTGLSEVKSALAELSEPSHTE